MQNSTSNYKHKLIKTMEEKQYNNNTFFIDKLYTEYTNDMSTIHLTLLPNDE